MRTRRNFGYMLSGLLCLLLIAPAVEYFAPLARALAQPMALGFAFAAAIWTLSELRSWRLVGLAAGIALGVAGTLGAVHEMLSVQVAAIVGFLAICVWSIALTLREVLIGPTVDINRIIGAVCVYMLFGILWGIAYLLIGVANPSAFEGIESSEYQTLSNQLFYFSFVTMTTLGYGDISPSAPLVRSLAYLQALAGQMYVATLVAGLVGVHVAQRMEQLSKQEPRP